MNRDITIPKLAPFLRDFTEAHRAEAVTLEILDGAIWKVQESGMPLAGLDLETRGSDAPALEILLGNEGRSGRGHLTHTVRRVTGVTVEIDEHEEERRIIVRGGDGTQAVLSFD